MIAGAMAGLSVLGGAMQAFGQIQAGNASKAAGEYNAGQLEQSAKLSLEKGAEGVRRLSIEEGQVAGENRVGFGANGIETDSGSPLLLAAANAREYSLAKLQTEHAAKVESIQATNQASISRYMGKQAQINSRYAAAGSLLGSFGSAGRVAMS